MLEIESPEASVERLFHEPPVECAKQAMDWHVVSAIHGRGTLLIGPLRHSPGGSPAGSVALAPPGVFVRTDAGAAEELSRKWWRLATWAPGVNLDQHRPIAHEQLSLARAAEYVWRRSPEHVDWMRATVRLQLDALLGLSRPDAAGMLSPMADRACNRLIELAGLAATAFGDEQELLYVERQLRPDRELFSSAARALARTSPNS